VPTSRKRHGLFRFMYKKFHQLKPRRRTFWENFSGGKRKQRLGRRRAAILRIEHLRKKERQLGERGGLCEKQIKVLWTSSAGRASRKWKLPAKAGETQGALGTWKREETLPACSRMSKRGLGSSWDSRGQKNCVDDSVLPATGRHVVRQRDIRSLA